MPTISRTIALETVYVVGSHDDFTEAIGDKLKALVQQHEGAELVVRHVSHAFAFHPDGQTHWSAFVTAELTTRDAG
jgi:hypothetical protein